MYRVWKEIGKRKHILCLYKAKESRRYISIHDFRILQSTLSERQAEILTEHTVLYTQNPKPYVWKARVVQSPGLS